MVSKKHPNCWLKNPVITVLCGEQNLLEGWGRNASSQQQAGEIAVAKLTSLGRNQISDFAKPQVQPIRSHLQPPPYPSFVRLLALIAGFSLTLPWVKERASKTESKQDRGLGSGRLGLFLQRKREKEKGWGPWRPSLTGACLLLFDLMAFIPSNWIT